LTPYDPVLPPPPLELPPPYPPPGLNDGRSDLHALNAAWSVGFDRSWLNRSRKPPPEAADGLGRVTPCEDRQLLNLANAALDPLESPEPPNPPDGRSEAHAWRALAIVLLLGGVVPGLGVLAPPRPNPVTPCSRRQLK
jgi:hypothetical protein